MLHPISDKVSFEDGAMIEPLSVGVHALNNLAQMRSGDNVIIFGAGPVGLLCMAVAKALGANRVVAVDIQEERLAFAKSYAATDVFISPPKKEGETGEAYAERASEELRAALNIPELGAGALDICIDASGAPSCIAMGLHLLKPSGTFVQVGMGPSTVPIPMFAIVTKQLKVLGSFRYGQGDYPLAISLVERGLVDLKPLVTHRYKFTDALEAFELTKKGKDADGKPVIKVIIDKPE
jgi:L-iditol 2-dehydrogenase/D-xylulose reductase